ncbi:MAG: hypothetical protein QXS54_10320 [Candidatus Methanomethylicaceae archaeon]
MERRARTLGACPSVVWLRAVERRDLERELVKMHEAANMDTCPVKFSG